MDIQKIARKNILNLKPYSSARNEYTGHNGILLDANENSFGSVVKGDYHRYPDPLQSELKEKIAFQKDVSPDCIFLGNGSDEAIDLLIRAFCEPGEDELMIFPPTYGMYKVCAEVNNIVVREVNLNPNFTLAIDDILYHISSKIKMVFFCSPNNPTGNLLVTEETIRILTDQNRLLVIDEAYIDFADSAGLLNLVPYFENLIILQTFSKSWGLAAIRMGLAFGHPEIIKIMNKIKYPYNINSLSQHTSLDALNHLNRRKKNIDKILVQRTYLSHHLAELEIVEHVFPSQANFLLVRFRDAQSVYKYLMQQNIIVRDRSQAVHCENCLRITVGTASENELLINTLKRFEG
jgi:histidinol-phosphate aminotransferase